MRSRKSARLTKKAKAVAIEEQSEEKNERKTEGRSENETGGDRANACLRRDSSFD